MQSPDHRAWRNAGGASARSCDELSAAVWTPIRHGRGAALTERAFVAADRRRVVEGERPAALLAPLPHLERHRGLRVRRCRRMCTVILHPRPLRCYYWDVASVTPVEPKPAASVVLVRDAQPGAPEPIEVYMIRRNRSMKFLGGYYAFPGGKVDSADGAPTALARCRGVEATEAEAIFTGHDGSPALAFWVTAVRELLEESGIMLACDGAGRALDGASPRTGDAIERCRN